MRGFVAVTDNEWYRYLRGLGIVDEVNFWRPSGMGFGALEIGEPLIFKLHYPENKIVGFGFYTYSLTVPSRIAWDAFGEKNGARTYEDMRQRIERYRRVPPDPRAEYDIGCVLLRDPVFLDETDWLDPPRDLSPHTQVGKTYDLSAGAGRVLWENLRDASERRRAYVLREPEPVAFGPPALRRQRLGQGTFRLTVLASYDKRCAVTGEKTLPVLAAAHVRPVTQGGSHQIVNGILLRSDVHTLFDRGYVTITPHYTVRVSRRLKEDFDNGELYRSFEGTRIALPSRSEWHPDRTLLEWHGDEVFLG